MKMRSALGQVRGLGSAKTGTENWYTERLTSLALVPLTLWLVVSLISGIGSDYQSLKEWMAFPGHMATLGLVIVVACWHGALALSVVVEDYVHNKTAEISCLVAIKFGATVWAVVAIVSILKLGLGR